jgi:HEAT repeat protein
MRQEAFHMPGWPSFAQRALFRLNYPDELQDEVLHAFVDQWSGFNEAALLRALRAGAGEQRSIAMRMIAEARIPQGPDALAAFLTSPDRAERWDSAWNLSEFHDARALPVLATMLTEGLPSSHEYLSRLGQLETREFLRMAAAHALGAAGDVTYVSALRRALQLVIDLEAGFPFLPSPAPGDDSPEADVWHSAGYDGALSAAHMYQRDLVYGLGQLGALGALTDLDTSALDRIDAEQLAREKYPVDPARVARRIEEWQMRLLAAYLLYVRHAMPVAANVRGYPMEDLAIPLGQQLQVVFGMSDADCERCMGIFRRGMMIGIVQQFHHEQSGLP